MLGWGGGNPSYLDGLGINWREMLALTSFGRTIFGPESRILSRGYGTRRAATVLRALGITDLDPPTPPQPGETDRPAPKKSMT
jgi:hypothetical protein